MCILVPNPKVDLTYLRYNDMKALKNQNGFSLFAVLILLTIMSVSVLFLVNNQQNNTQINTNTNTIQLARLMASNELAYDFNEINEKIQASTGLGLALRQQTPAAAAQAPCVGAPIPLTNDNSQDIVGANISKYLTDTGNTAIADLISNNPGQILVCLVNQGQTYCPKVEGDANYDTVCDIYQLRFQITLKDGTQSFQTLTLSSALYKR